MQKSLLDFTTNDEQREIILAVKSSTQIADIKKEDLIDYIVKARILLGVTKDYNNKEELVIAAQFVSKQFGYLTSDEFELAFMLFVLNKYDTDIQFYGFFSPLFISQVLNAYIYYRKIKLSDVIRSKEKYEENLLMENNKPTPEQICNSTKEIIVDFWNTWKQKNEFSDYLSISYDFFRKHKDLFKFHFDQKRLDLANEWANKKLSENRRSNGFFKFKEQDEVLQKKKYARIYCVMDYFSRFQNIETITNKITPDLWS